MKSTSNPLERLNDSNVNNLEMKRSSSNDLKDQLSKLQKKLNNNSLNKSDFSRSIDPEIHLPPILSSKENLNNPLNNSPLTARKRNSMPMVKNVRAGTRNVDFLGDLSDGLLIESRRLTYENKQFKERITKLTTDNDSLNKQLSNISLVNTKLSNKEEELNDKIWDLETNLGKLKSSLSNSNKDVERLKMEKISLINSLEEFKNNFELFKIEKFQIEEENSLKIVKLKDQSVEFQIQNDNLNDENDILHKKILTLEENLQDAKDKHLQMQLEQQNSTRTVNNIDDSFSEFDDSIVQDPTISKLNESEFNALDIETLRRNLKHAYSTITRLRNQNNKFKTNSNSPISINKKNKLFAKLENTASESNQSILPEDTWENYEEDSFAHANSSMKIPSLTKSDDESDSDNDIYLQNLSQLETSSPVNVRNSSNLSTANIPYCLLILPKDTLEIVDNEMTIDKLFSNFNEFQALPMKKNDYKHLMAISENEKQLSFKIKGDKTVHSPVPITSTKYVNNNNVRLVTIQELDDLKDSIREKDSQIQHWKSIISQSSLIESSPVKTEELLDHNSTCSKLTSKEKEVRNMISDTSISSIMPDLSISSIIPIPIKTPIPKFNTNSSLDKLLSAKDAELSTKDFEIMSLKSLISGLETKLGTSEPQLKNSQNNLETQIEEKESTLANLQAKLESTEKELNFFKKEAEENKLPSESIEKKKQLNLVASKEKELNEIKSKLESKHTEYEKLKSLYEKPSMEYIKSKSEIHNFVAIPMEEHNSMKLFLKEIQEEAEKKKIELSELQNVKSELEAKKITLQELETTKDEMSKKIVALIDMQKQLDIVNGQLELKHDELADIKKAYESPSIEYIKAKSEKHGLVAVSMKQHESIKSELDFNRAELLNFTSNTSEMMKKIEDLQNYKADFENATKDLESKHKELELIKSAYNSPSIDYVKSKSETHGLIAVPIKRHESLREELEIKEKKISNLEHIEYELKNKNSELENLKKNMSELNQKFNEKETKLAEVNEALDLKSKELVAFKSYYDSPAVDYIKTKSEIHGLIAVPMIEHESMQSELKSKEEELEKLQGIKDGLEAKNSELQDLRDVKAELDKKVQILQVKELKLNELDYKLATKIKELEELKLSHNEPSLDYIKVKSELHGLVAFPMTEHASMKSELKSKQEELKELENVKSELDELLISKKELTRKVEILEKKEIDLDNAAAQLEMKHKEFNDLRSAYETPTADYIKSKSVILGFTTVPLAEYVSTKTQLTDSENALKKKETELAALRKIRENLESRIRVESGHLSSVSLEHHESVQSELEQAKNDLARSQKDFECVKIQSDSKQKEIENLTITRNELSSRVDKLAALEEQLEELEEIKHKLDLSHEELQQLKSEKENMSKRIDILKEKEKELDEVNNKLTKINSAYETPDPEYIKSKSTALGLVSLSKDDHDSFKDELERKEEEIATLQKRKEDFESAEKELQKLKLVNTDMEKNIELLKNKDRELDDVKSELKSKMDELDKIKTLLNSPSVDYIKSKSEAHNLVSVPIVEHVSTKTLLKNREEEIEKKEMELLEFHQIQKDLESRQLELENLKALKDEIAEENLELKSTNSELVSKNQELSKIKTAYESPSVDYIKKKSSALGILTVPIKEHTSMKNDSVRKAQLLKENQRQLAELQGLRFDVTDKQNRLNALSVKINELEAENDALSNIKVQYESPSEEYLKSRALSIGLVLMPFEKHENFESDLDSKKMEVDKLRVVKMELSKRVEELEKKEKKLDQVNELLEARRKELESIQAKYDAPSYNYIIEKSGLHGLTAIPMKEHESMKTSLTEKSCELVLKQQELDGLQEVKCQLDLKQKEIEGLKSLQKNLSERVTALDVKEKELNDLKSVLSIKNDELSKLKKEVELKKLAPDSPEKKKRIDTVSKKELELNKLKSELESKRTEFGDLKLDCEQPSMGHSNSKSDTRSMASISMDEHASIHTRLQECEAQLQQEEEDLAILDDIKSQLEFKNIEFDKLTSMKDGLLKRVEELEKRETEFITLQNVLTKKDTELKELRNKPSEKMLILEAPQTKCGIDENQKLENQLEAIKLELQSKNDELDTMKLLHGTLTVGDTPISQSLLEQQAKSKGFTLLPFSEYNKNFSMQKSASGTSTVTNISVETESGLDSAHKNVTQMRTPNPSLDYLISALDKKGFKSIPMEEYEHLVDGSFNPNSLEIESSPNAYGRLVPSLDVRGDGSHEVNIITSQLELKKHALQNLTKQSKEYKKFELENAQKELQKEKEELLRISRRQSHSSFISNSSTSSTVSVEDVLSTKKRNIKERENELQSRIFKLEKEKSATEVQLENNLPQIKKKKLEIKLAKIADDLEVNVAELQSQKNVLETVDAYITSAKKMNLSPVKESYSSKDYVAAADSCLIERKQDQVNKLEQKLHHIEEDIASVDMLNDSKLRSEIETKNLEITNLENKLRTQNDKMREAVTNIDESDLTHIIEQLTALGYSVSKEPNIVSQKELMVSSTSLNSVGASEYHDAVSQNDSDFALTEKYDKSDLKELDDEFDIKAAAFKFGFNLVPIGSVITNKDYNKVDNLTFSNIQWKAHNLGYEIVNADELKKLKERSLENSEPDELDRSQLQFLADKLNLRILSEDDVKRLKKRKVTSKELASKAAELNLVLLSEEEVADLKLRSPLTVENLSDVAKQLSMLCIPESQFVATTICRTPDIPNVVVLPITYYKRLLRSHDWYKNNKDKSDFDSSVKKSNTIQDNASFDLEPPKLFSGKSAIANETSNFSLAQLANPSNIDLASLHTVNTVISSNGEMIAAITQTIIGEYLFKYYRRLGPFSSISDSRHERYFWIHPYSLTLYWSTANPVLNDPAKNNIKAVAIIGVKSIEDNNPLPPGLYHRSIIITSYDKVVKITCPTRQRHNIWLNSIRYLLEKSTENLVDDDDAEDQYNETFNMDKKLEVERSQSQIFRHQQPRNSSILAQNQSHKDRIASAPSRSNTLRNIVASSLRQGSPKS